jgi:hypothetical protein
MSSLLKKTANYDEGCDGMKGCEIKYGYEVGII